MIHHVIVLVHGIMGNPKELGYVHQAIEREFANFTAASVNGGSTTSSSHSTMLVHSATSNEQESLDGIQAGGLRLATEINELLEDLARNITKERQQKQQIVDDSNDNDNKHEDDDDDVVALSFLGFSLGGLYSRYSLPYIHWKIEIPKDEFTSNTTIKVIPNMFATAATPHIGIKNMTYWKLPSCLEPIAAWYLGQTGKDLFRRPRRSSQRRIITADECESGNEHGNQNECYYDDIIQQICLDSKFLLPLSKFKTRLAFANAFSTDFAVHTATAAFLADDDDDDDNDDGYVGDEKQIHMTSTHFLVEDNIDVEQCKTEDENTCSASTINQQFPTARFITPTTWSCETKESNKKYDILEGHDVNNDTERETRRPLMNGQQSSCTLNSRARSASVSTMARTLDSLGWTKIFVDVRPHIPALWKRRRSQEILGKDYKIPPVTFTASTDSSEDQSMPSAVSAASAASISSMYSSSTLKQHLSGKGFDGNTLPFGHSFLVASTKNAWYTWFYKDGRLFVDQIFAKELVQQMISLEKE